MSKNKFFPYNFKQLINYGAYLGHHKKKRAFFINNYLLGHRNNMDIFNLNNTIFSLNKIIPLIQSTIENSGKILIIAENAKFIPHISDTFKQYNQPIYTGTWVLGTLTNFKELHKIKSNSSNSLSRLPDLIIIINSSHPNYILNEAKILEIPTILFNDSNINPFNATYTIPTNNTSLDLTHLYLNIIQKTIANSYAKLILNFSS